ncbi:MAG: hypothetical protein JSV03_06315, partial [Planctomycetota bacterium]
MANKAGDNNEFCPNVFSNCRHDRRRFLQKLCWGTMGAISSQAVLRNAYSAQGGEGSNEATPAKLPTIKIGNYHLTRLIAGSNPVEGFSHSTRNLASHMNEYFTVEQTVKFISRCEKLGINTWQSGHGPVKKVTGALEKLREQGSKIHWMCLYLEKSPVQKSIKDILALKPIAIIHHGGATDAIFRAGKMQKVHDFVKMVHDAGVMAGISAHNPANIAYIEEKGWENDFFMGCFYHVSRPKQEIREKLGTIPLGELFLESDPDEMTKVIQQVKRPCLGFKILAAGRNCWTSNSVESAFKYAFNNIKKTDGVIVGMYPRFSD